MNLSIRHKLFLAFLLATGLIVLGMVLFMSWSFERGFVRFVEARQQEHIEALIERLVETYETDRGWDRLAADRARWVSLLALGREPTFDSPMMPRHAAGMMHGMHDESNAWPPRRALGLMAEDRSHLPIEFRVMLLDAAHSIIFGRSDLVGNLELHPIEVGDRIVGFLGVLPGPPLERIGEVRFLQEQRDAFVLIALGMVLVSAALALPLAHGLVMPLRSFGKASRALAEGKYDTRIPVRSRDELGRMARDFNELAQALERNEHIRRQWVADISHELRTPLSVLHGEIEALQDGVRPLEPAAIDSLHTDVLRLGRLIDDLYELSMSDLGALDYRKVATDIAYLLEENLDALRPEFDARGIRLEPQMPFTERPTLLADPDRLSQLFGNLLQNSLRYTDPGGRLVVRLTRAKDRATIDFEDSEPGVDESDLPHLFERFYRVEGSRSRALGGAGLGLAICANIVEAHGGSIHARRSAYGGLWVQVELPLGQ